MGIVASEKLNFLSVFERANSGSRGQGKFNPLNNEQVKSSLAMKVWSHEGSKLYPKVPPPPEARMPDFEA